MTPLMTPFDLERAEQAKQLEALKPVSMSVPPDGEFALNLWALISKHKPKRIVETGTYIGGGTTAIIASAIDDLITAGHGDAKTYEFRTIEADKEACKIAEENIAKSGFGAFTTVHNGLTIPRSKLPTAAEIKAWTVDGIADLPIDVDHNEVDRVYRYYAETAHLTCPDNMLQFVVSELMDGKPDLALLDSGGAIGLQEFEYLISLLKGPCFIACDDVFHVKHYRSFQIMLDDPRFDIRVVGKERYGYCIARFEP